MNLKISTIIKSVTSMIVLIFSMYCFTMNYEILLPIGIASLFSAFIISPIFDIVCKKTNKKFSLFQKLTLEYGMINIIYIFVFISFIRGENYIIYIKYIVMIIIILFTLFFLFNRNKYNQTIYVPFYKRILLIVVSIFIINLPIILFKMIFLNNYYETKKDYYNFEILQTTNLYSYTNVINKVNFNNLSFRDDFKNYTLKNTEDKRVYIKKNDVGVTESGITFEKDYLSKLKLNTDKVYGFNNYFSKKFLEKYDISSDAEKIEFMNSYNLNIFNSLYDILIIDLLSIINANEKIKNYQKIELSNNINVYLLEKKDNNLKNNYVVYVDYKDYSYIITFVSTQENTFNKNYIIDFIRTLNIN